MLFLRWRTEKVAQKHLRKIENEICGGQYMNENNGTFIIVTWNNEKEIEDCLSTVSRYS